MIRTMFRIGSLLSILLVVACSLQELQLGEKLEQAV